MYVHVSSSYVIWFAYIRQHLLAKSVAVSVLFFCLVKTPFLPLSAFPPSTGGYSRYTTVVSSQTYVRGRVRGPGNRKFRGGRGTPRGGGYQPSTGGTLNEERMETGQNHCHFCERDSHTELKYFHVSVQ